MVILIFLILPNLVCRLFVPYRYIRTHSNIFVFNSWGYYVSAIDLNVDQTISSVLWTYMKKEQSTDY